MPNPLIELDELSDLLAGGGPVVLADVRWTLNGPPGRLEYEAGHLPGAQWVDLEADLSGPPGEGGRHPLPHPEVLDEALRRIGVSAETAVVAYDGATSLSAARLWWLLTDAGHDRVRVLNGGFRAWSATGRPIETGPARPVRPGTWRGRPGQRRRWASAELAQAIRSNQAPTLVDVRAGERYEGTSEPIDSVAGHIPGAVNRPSMEQVDAAGRFLETDAIENAYADLTAPVFYCGSGITAAHSLLALESTGRTDGAIYPGSWSSWITDGTRPVVTGAGGDRRT